MYSRPSRILVVLLPPCPPVFHHSSLTAPRNILSHFSIHIVCAGNSFYNRGHHDYSLISLTMESEKKNGLFVIIALVVVALLVWWLWPTSSGPGSGQAVGDDSGQSTQASAPPPPPQLAPELQLTADEKAGNIAEKKARGFFDEFAFASFKIIDEFKRK